MSRHEILTHLGLPTRDRGASPAAPLPAQRMTEQPQMAARAPHARQVGTALTRPFGHYVAVFRLR